MQQLAIVFLGYFSSVLHTGTVYSNVVHFNKRRVMFCKVFCIC